MISPLLSPPPLETAWKRQKVPIASSRGVTSVGITLRCSLGEVHHLRNLTHSTAITPRRYHLPRDAPPPVVTRFACTIIFHYHRGTLDTTRPQETTPGDKKSRTRNCFRLKWFFLREAQNTAPRAGRGGEDDEPNKLPKNPSP